jgi:hypothetical protein
VDRNPAEDRARSAGIAGGKRPSLSGFGSWDQQCHAQGSLLWPGAKFLKSVAAGRVFINALDEYSCLLPSAIHAQSTERSIYERLLFAGFPDATTHDVTRRKTLILALRIADRLRAAPNPEDVRWILYGSAD